MTKKRTRKAPSKKKRTSARRTKRGGDTIPLPVLKKRLAKLRRLVTEREAKSQTRMWT
jgi:hypothetical protein